MQTAYLVQAFYESRNRVFPEPLKPCRTEDAAIAMAHRLAQTRVAVVAFEQEAKRRRVLLKLGDLPPGFFE